MLDARLGRLFGLLMGICFYIAGFLKTLLCLPRPPSPPIVPLENAYDWLVHIVFVIYTLFLAFLVCT